MIRRLPLILAAAALAVVAAGCGTRSSKPYTATGTAPCMAKKGFTKVTVLDEGLGVWRNRNYGTRKGIDP